MPHGCKVWGEIQALHVNPTGTPGGKGACYWLAGMKVRSPYVSSLASVRLISTLLLLTRVKSGDIQERGSLLWCLLKRSSCCLDVSVLLGCPFPSPLTKKSRFCWAFIGVAGFLSSGSGIYKAKRKLRGTTCLSLRPHIPSQSDSLLTSSDSSYILFCFVLNVQCPTFQLYIYSYFPEVKFLCFTQNGVL